MTRPTVLRFPKGAVCEEIPAVSVVDGLDVLMQSGDEDVLVLACGALAGVGLEVGAALLAQGIGVTVVDPRWVIPVSTGVVAQAARHRLVVTIEDNLRVGGVGSAVALAMRDAGVGTPLRDFGIPQRFLDHGKRSEVLAECGLTAQEISLAVVESVAKLDAALL